AGVTAKLRPERRLPGPPPDHQTVRRIDPDLVRRTLEDHTRQPENGALRHTQVALPFLVLVVIAAVAVLRWPCHLRHFTRILPQHIEMVQVSILRRLQQFARELSKRGNRVILTTQVREPVVVNLVASQPAERLNVSIEDAEIATAAVSGNDVDV